MSDPTQKIAVLGAGSWGTALAALVARHGHPTVLWGRDAAMVDAIDRTHENPRYLPGIALPDSLRATTDLQQTIAGASWILVVVPSHAFTETIKLLAPLRQLARASPGPPRASSRDPGASCMKWRATSLAPACRWPW